MNLISCSNNTTDRRGTTPPPHHRTRPTSRGGVHKFPINFIEKIQSAFERKFLPQKIQLRGGDDGYSVEHRENIFICKFWPLAFSWFGRRRRRCSARNFAVTNASENGILTTTSKTTMVGRPRIFIGFLVFVDRLFFER